MKQPTRRDDATRGQRRQPWLQQAEAAFDLLFDASEQQQLVTFSQREQRAAALGKELAAWLLAQHLAADPAVRPPAEAPPACPRAAAPGSGSARPPGRCRNGS
jgi:hypothetical protein